MINNPFHQEDAIAQQKDSNRRILLGIVCAVAVTALLIAGYALIRRQHAKQILAASTPPPTVDNGGPKGPPLAHIVVDEPTLEKGFTVIGGAVKNISDRELSDVVVFIEARRRKDGGIEEVALPVTPPVLQPQQEGAYSMKAPAQDFASIRLSSIAVKGESEPKAIAYTSSQGKKRPAERFEPKVVVIKRSGKPGEFINTPDNPTRVP